MNCHIIRSALTSGMVTIDYIKALAEPEGISSSTLARKVFRQRNPLTDKDPDAVVVGFDTTLTYEKLSKAHIDSK